MTQHVTSPASAEEELDYSEARWALIERIVASKQLKRSARLREFLLYVAQRAIKDGLDQIHEQEIGAKVFGRPTDYDTSLDNIVRVNASELRKRIGDYFDSDGVSEALVMEIPRGSYKPIFRTRAASAVIEPPPPVDPIAESTPTKDEPKSSDLSPARVERRLLVVAAVLIIALGASCALLLIKNRSLRQQAVDYRWQDKPALGAFWSGMLNNGTATDIVLADTSFALVEDISRKSIPLSDYLSRDYVSKLGSPPLSQDRRNDLEMIMQRNNGSLGDFRAANRLLALDPKGKGFHLYSARDYTPALFKQDNLILIGARKSNPWVDLLEGSLNFAADYDMDKKIDYIRNKAPAAGERETYIPTPKPSSDGYCIVAYLPNPEQSGKAIIIAGTDSAATEGGGDFLSSDQQLSKLAKMLKVSTLPYFEVLLKTTNLSGTPIDEKIVAYRTYPGVH